MKESDDVKPDVALVRQRLHRLAVLLTDEKAEEAVRFLEYLIQSAAARKNR